MQKYFFKNSTFLPIYWISLKLKEYVSTYAGPLKFSKPAREQCYPKVMCDPKLQKKTVKVILIDAPYGDMS